MSVCQLVHITATSSQRSSSNAVRTIHAKINVLLNDCKTFRNVIDYIWLVIPTAH